MACYAGKMPRHTSKAGMCMLSLQVKARAKQQHAQMGKACTRESASAGHAVQARARACVCGKVGVVGKGENVGKQKAGMQESVCVDCQCMYGDFKNALREERPLSFFFLPLFNSFSLPFFPDESVQCKTSK